MIARKKQEAIPLETGMGEFWAPHRGGVSLTFYDGGPSQLEKAIPLMDERGIKGTFFLCPGFEESQEALAPWREVAARGHEIGIHTFSHTMSSNHTGGYGLEDMTLAQMEQDLLRAQEVLGPLAPHQRQWTFCYPSYERHVGRGTGRQSYVPLVAKQFLAGRSGAEYGCANHPQTVDLACVWGLDTPRMSGFEMIGLAEELTRRARWVVFAFHDIDGPRLTVGNHDFVMLLNYLAASSDRILTAPFGAVAERIALLQEGSMPARVCREPGEMGGISSE